MACRKKEEAIKSLKSDERGLNEKEASKRLEKYGKNIIDGTNQLSGVKILLSQFKSYIVYVLLGVALISLLIKHYVDAGVIFAIVILNAGLGFIQQYKAEKSIVELKKLLVPKCKVLRDGKMKIISSTDVVLGDILVINTGDKIVADCRILSCDNLEVNEAILTGESLSIEKIYDKVSANTILAERKNMLYTGTSVVKGNCKAVVVATAMNTEFGKIASGLEEINIAETPMQKKMSKFAMQISIFVVLIAFIIALVGIIGGKDKFEIFLIAVALATSAIPEGLPAVITISLAFATKRMLKHNVIGF